MERCRFKATIKKNELDNLKKTENPDFICFNETKIDNDLIKSMDLKNIFQNKYKLKSFWNCSTEKKDMQGQPF